MGYIIAVLLNYLGASVPAYVVGKRRGARTPAVAFVPVVGPWIVILWSIEQRGWLVLLMLIPLANVVFAVGVALNVPSEQGRTRWWALGFLIPVVNWIAFWVYAFTLKADRPAATPAVTA